MHTCIHIDTLLTAYSADLHCACSVITNACEPTETLYMYVMLGVELLSTIISLNSISVLQVHVLTVHV